MKSAQEYESLCRRCKVLDLVIMLAVRHLEGYRSVAHGLADALVEAEDARLDAWDDLTGSDQNSLEIRADIGLSLLNEENDLDSDLWAEARFEYDRFFGEISQSFVSPAE